MPKRQHRRKPRKPGAPAKRRQRARVPQQGQPHSRGEEPDLVTDIATALDDGHPLSLLALASSLLSALEPRRRSPFEPEPEAELDLPSRDGLVQMFLAVDQLETSALLAVIAEFSREDVLRRRVGRELASRSHALPSWLTELHRAQPAGVIEVVHVLGDGDNVMVGVQLPGGCELTAVVYIDHNMGTLVKDAFVVPGPVGELAARMLDLAADPDTEARDLDPADARARITAAIELGSITFPPFETDTWPACRPLVEWVAAMLPPDGTGYQRPAWDPAALATLAERFLASPFAAGFDTPDHRGLLESLLWFGTDYGPGDPLRWSPTAVEIVLIDWIPRKIVADVSYLAKAPDLLKAFIRFCHQERAVRCTLTAQTLDAVDSVAPEYQQAIRSPRPQGPAALLAAMGALAPGDPLGGDKPVDYQDMMLDALRRAVGDDDALDRLDADALPDEPFAWEAIPADVHDRVGEVLALVDQCCDELLDVEYRTACRRMLARVAAGDPEIFRRRGRANTAAAALCWVIGKANKLFDPEAGARRVQVKDLVGHFGIAQGSVSQRSEPLLRAVGVDPHPYGALELGSPGYLTSARRARIIALRDDYRAMQG